MALIDNVVGAYHLDGSGSTVTDSTSTSDGTATGTSSVSGKINNARDFNGSSDDIFLNRIAPSNNQKSFAFWVNPDNAAGNTFPFSIGYTPNTISGRGGFVINAGKAQFFQAGETTLQSTTTLVNGVWYFIVGVKDGTSGKLYVNGVEEDSTNSWTAANMIGDLTLGRLTSTFFDGQIDEVILWDRAITQEEVTELHNSGDGNAYPFIDLIAQSTSFESNNGTFVSAILTPTFTGNTPTFRMRADKTKAFEDVTVGVRHFFANTGSEVQWQAEGSGTIIQNIKIEAFR